MSKTGADVSKWNKINNYTEVKNAGLDFAIVKVINSSNKADGLFHTHVAGFSGAGIPIIGGYTYSYANTTEKAKKSADAFVSIGAPKGIDTMWLDLEDNAVKGLGSKIVDIINVYRDTAKSAGMGFGIYTGLSYYKPYLKPYIKQIEGIPIWWARYPYVKDFKISTAVPDAKYLPTDFAVSGWQYTSKGVVSGISGYVDLNVWYDSEPFDNTAEQEIPIESNPFTEPIMTVRYGAKGNDASYVQWYCWRFGCFMDSNGQPIIDTKEIDGIFGAKTQNAVKEVQRRLGMAQTGEVSAIDRAVWKKLL